MVEEEEAVVDAVVAVALLDLHIRFALGLGPTMGSGRSTRPPAANHLCLAMALSLLASPTALMPCRCRIDLQR
jgi:hypothetical protein